MKIAICDDHLETLDELCFFLKEIPLSANADVYAFNTSVALIDKIKAGEKFDVYILDILIDSNLGIDIAKTIRIYDGDSNIIFITSSPDYAVQSYEYCALHYLLKPVNYKDLQNALMRINLNSEPTLLCISQGSGQLRVNLSDIICILNNKNQQRVITVHTEAHLNSTIKEIATELAEHKMFYRLSSGCILNLTKVVGMTSKQVTLENGHVVTIPRGRYRILKGLCENVQGRKM